VEYFQSAILIEVFDRLILKLAENKLLQFIPVHRTMLDQIVHGDINEEVIIMPAYYGHPK
jgi:hypothetical protein